MAGEANSWPFFGFRDGVLEIGDASCEMRIEWGKAPRAQQRTRHARARWKPFWPDFRLLGVTPTGVEDATDTSGTRKAEAFEAFRQVIPDELLETAEGFQSHQWMLLKFLQEAASFRDLAASNRTVAYCLANNAEFRNTSETVATRLAVPHSYGKQKEIAEWLGFPGNTATTRLLRRIAPEVATLATLRYLRAALHRDPKVAQLLAHQPVLGCGVVALACSLATTALVSPQLLEEVAAREYEFRDAPTCEQLDHAVDLLREMEDTRTIRPFRSVAAVNAFHEEIAAEYETFQERRIVQRKKDFERKHLFPDPPVPGSDTIVPITSDIELRNEGKEQRNCVASYINHVRTGGYYFYRVLSPQRATLAISLGAGGAWRRHEVKLKANRQPSTKTVAHVDAWLYQHSLSA